jgi:hypothetical protein
MAIPLPVPTRTLVAGFPALLLASVLASPALADTVTLKSGRSLEGIARREPGKVVVDTGGGTLTFPSAEVQEVVPGRTALHEYQDRSAKLGDRPAAGQVFELAMWARDQRLDRYVDPLLRRTIEIDPNHREARRLLGYVPFEGQWILRQQRDQQTVAGEREPQRDSRKGTNKETKRTAPRSVPEVSPGYMYFGIPPSVPRRGSQNHGGGYGFALPIFRGVVVGP